MGTSKYGLPLFQCANCGSIDLTILRSLIQTWKQDSWGHRELKPYFVDDTEKTRIYCKYCNNSWCIITPIGIPADILTLPEELK